MALSFPPFTADLQRLETMQSITSSTLRSIALLLPVQLLRCLAGFAALSLLGEAEASVLVLVSHWCLPFSHLCNPVECEWSRLVYARKGGRSFHYHKTNNDIFKILHWPVFTKLDSITATKIDSTANDHLLTESILKWVMRYCSVAGWRRWRKGSAVVFTEVGLADEKQLGRNSLLMRLVLVKYCSFNYDFKLVWSPELIDGSSVMMREDLLQ